MWLPFTLRGAEIVGIVGGTPAVVRDVAEALAIPYAGTEWAPHWRLASLIA